MGLTEGQIENFANAYKTRFLKIAHEDAQSPEPVIDFSDCKQYVEKRYSKKAFLHSVKHFIKVFYRIDPLRDGKISFAQYWEWRKGTLRLAGLKDTQIDVMKV